MRQLCLVLLFLTFTSIATTEKEKTTKKFRVPISTTPSATTRKGPCLPTCTRTFYKDLENLLGRAMARRLQQLDVEVIINILTENAKFKAFCGKYRTFKGCIQTCSPSFLLEIVKQGGKIIDYFCTDRYDDIIKWFPCVGDVTADSECMENCKTHYDSVKNVARDFRSMMLSGDTEQAQEVFGQICSYMICTLDCDMTAVWQRCHPQTARLLKDLVVHPFDIVKDLVLGIGALDSWPSECSSLQNYTFVPPTTTPAKLAQLRLSTTQRPKSTDQGPATTTRNETVSGGKEGVHQGWVLYLVSTLVLYCTITTTFI